LHRSGGVRIRAIGHGRPTYRNLFCA
jgi:hypothetical protein